VCVVAWVASATSSVTLRGTAGALGVLEAPPEGDEVAGGDGPAGTAVDPPRSPVRAIDRAVPRRDGAPGAGSTIAGPAVTAADPRPAAPVGTPPPEVGAEGRLTLGVEELSAAGQEVNATRPVAKSSETRAAPISDAALPAPASNPRLCSKEGNLARPLLRLFGPSGRRL
jgi:hypothetical protein